MDRHLRRRLGALLADGFGDEWVRSAAHYGAAPDWRLLARAGRTPIAQAAVWKLRSRPRELAVFGIGDVVVADDHRGKGLAERLVDGAVELAHARGAHVIVARTVLLRGPFGRAGFRALERGECPALADADDWMAWFQGDRLPELEWLEPDDV